jgi:hypothetical protein
LRQLQPGIVRGDRVHMRRPQPCVVLWAIAASSNASNGRASHAVRAPDWRVAGRVARGARYSPI